LLELLQFEAAELEASAQPAGTQLRIWSHGDHPGARALAAATGYRVVRELLQLRRSLDGLADSGEVTLPAGVTLRSFRPGTDDATWLRLNARAFAHHPEQGRMAQSDLDARMAEPWFDPSGFLIAEQDGVMIGFHWTKVHPEGLGEVYVVGVDPDRHGGGLGRALTLAGLQHLHERGVGIALLYVESDNVPALAVYHRLGFTTWHSDVMYAPAVDSAS
jgi:mycothiol synthase